MKVGDALHHGPFGALVRVNAIHPPFGHHSYVTTPEIVEDISRALGMTIGKMFVENTTSCVVKFACDDVGRWRIQAALYYLLAVVHQLPPDDNSITYVDREGVGVPPTDVESVLELIAESKGTFREGRVHRAR